MIRRVLRWVPALRALNPLNPKNGWARVRRRNFQLINIYEHEATNRIGGFRGMRDEDGHYKLHCVVLQNTPENKKAILGGLASAARVDKIASAEIEDVVADLKIESGSDAISESVLEEFETKLEKALEGDALKSAYAELNASYQRLDASIEAAKAADSDHLERMCEDFRAEHFGDLPKGAFKPPKGERARKLWLGNYPEAIKEIHARFPSTSHRRRRSILLKKVREYIKDTGLLAEMLVGAYPDLERFPHYVEELINPPRGRKMFINVDHFLAQLADCCFNFVVMWSFVNQSVGATNRHLAKREYVSLDLANEIRDTAVEVLRGVRARVAVSA